jgi:histidine ammonia-lyase
VIQILNFLAFNARNFRIITLEGQGAAMADAVSIEPGKASLDIWRRLYNGGSFTIDRRSKAAVDAAADVIVGIVREGAPVYGVNAGFGKLANAEIKPDQLAVLQKNLILSHAAGVGDALPAQIVRLIMA